MARYAETTTVSVEKSKAEIEQLIERFGARKLVTGYDKDEGIAMIQFEVRDRRVMFRLTIPDDMARTFVFDARGRKRPDAARLSAHAQEEKRLWRSLFLVIKAKLESVESGIESFEEAFLPQIVIPGSGGQTYGDFAVPQIAHVYETRELPAMLPGVSPAEIKQLGVGQ